MRKREASLHIQLVERSARGVTLTEAGARLYEHACCDIEALRVGRPADGTLVTRHLTTFRHVLVAAPSLLDRLGMPASAAQLKTYPRALWAANASSVIHLAVEDEHVVLDPILSSNDYAHLRRCAEAGEAVTELPEFLARPAINAGRLQEVMMTGPANPYSFFLSCSVSFGLCSFAGLGLPS